jgi:CheY-like chemotaxis protein
VRAAQILIGLKIAFTPGRFEKVLDFGPKGKSTQPGAVPNGRTILILEHDVTVANILKEMLEDHGFRIEIALDGGTALRRIRQTQPKAILLDVLVPGISGFEVLKRTRALEAFRETPVVVFTSGFSSFSENQLLAAGATRVFSKGEISPRKILEVFEELLGPVEPAPSRETADKTPLAAVGGPICGESAASAAASDEDEIFLAEIQESFLQQAPVLMRDLQGALDSVVRLPSAENLFELYQKLQALSANAGLARLSRVGCLADATAGLVEHLQSKQEPLTNCLRKTLTQATSLIKELFGRADEFMPFKAPVMAVDDDEVSRRVLAHALRKVDLRPEVFESSEQALKRLQELQFELIFLDVGMPGMNGFELCKKIRALPQYADTAVVFVTSRDSMEAHLESARSGGSDFIKKPFVIRELAVKALIYLLQKSG